MFHTLPKKEKKKELLLPPYSWYKCEPMGVIWENSGFNLHLTTRIKARSGLPTWSSAEILWVQHSEWDFGRVFWVPWPCTDLVLHEASGRAARRYGAGISPANFPWPLFCGVVAPLLLLFLHCSVVNLFIIKVRIRLNKLLMLLCSLMRRKCFWGTKTTTEV